MKYDCDLIRDILPLYNDGALSKKSNEIVEEHLKDCAACKKAYGLCESEETEKAEEIVDAEEKMAEADEKTADVKTYLTRIKHRRIAVALSVFAVVAMVVAGVAVVVKDRTTKQVEASMSSQKREFGYVEIAGILCALDADIVDLSGKTLNQDDKDNLCKLTALTNLNLSDTSLTDVSFIAELTTLTDLNISNNNITDISVLEACEHMRKLDVSNNKIEDISVVGSFEKLWALYADENMITDVSPLIGLTELSVISLNDNKITDITPLIDLNNVYNDSIYLSVANNEITDLTGMDGFRTYYLDLEGNKIKDMTVVSTFTGLITLNVSDTGISDLGFVTSLDKLNNLYAESNSITDISPLAELTVDDVTELYLGDNLITDISVLEEVSGLSFVSFENNNITDFSALKGKLKLEALYITGNPVTEEDAEEIEESLPNGKVFY